MRISIRRCLSMLRNTGGANELALPATNAYQSGHVDQLRMRWCAEDLGLSLRWQRIAWSADLGWLS